MNTPPPTEPIRLTIFHRGDVLTLDLVGRDTLSPRSEVRAEPEFLSSLRDRADRLAEYANRWGGRTGEGDPVPGELKSLGRVIYDQLFSEPVRRRLAAAGPADLLLKTDESLAAVPWELAWDGSGFLCDRFRIGRQVAVGSGREEGGGERTLSSPLRMLIVADPQEDLEGARRECEAILGELRHLEDLEITMVGGKRVEKLWLLGNIGRFDIVHYAGHAFHSREEPEKSGWLLSGGRITAAEMSRISNPPALVFANACRAGAAGSSGYRYEGEAFGIGGGFLRAGVRNYIGPFWVIHDQPSIQFALTFYRSLFRGETLGESLQASRREIVARCGRGELLWAAYILYGDPEFAPAARPAPPPDGISIPAGDPRPAERAAGERPRGRAGKRIAGALALLAAAAAAGLYLRHPAARREVAAPPGEVPLPPPPAAAPAPPGDAPSAPPPAAAPAPPDRPRPAAERERPPAVYIDLAETIDGEPSAAAGASRVLADALAGRGYGVIDRSVLASADPALPGRFREGMARFDRAALAALGGEHGIGFAVDGTAGASLLRTDDLLGTTFYVYRGEVTVRVVDTSEGKLIFSRTVREDRGAQDRTAAAGQALRGAAAEMARLLPELPYRQEP